VIITDRPFLTFAIPTWNRAKEVEISARSIAEQIKESGRDDIQILIQDDASSDGTKEVIESLRTEFPFIRATLREERSDYSAAFRDLFRSCESDWVWTFGDDDFLEPGSLQTLLKTLEENPELEFIHCAETPRCAGTNALYKGKLLRLCNMFGWLEMTGFITCNIVKGSKLKEAAASPRWDLYAKSSFVQSCALLEVLKDSPSALMDSPLVRTQSADQTEDCIKRWQADKIGERYLKIVDAMQVMYDVGILTEKVKRAFFRYHQYHFWDRHMVYFVTDYTGQGMIRPPDMWFPLVKMTEFLEDEQFAKSLAGDIETVRGMITLHQFLVANCENINLGIEDVYNRHIESIYPWAYVIPREAIVDK
jgi:abequosyltransferase